MTRISSVPGAGRPKSAARIGIGGSVGSGKTALIEALLPRMNSRGIEVAAVTSGLFTKEDALRLAQDLRGDLVRKHMSL